jgi:hypothetical protein
MRLPLAYMAVLLFGASAACAQTASGNMSASSSGGSSTIRGLLSAGYEIKSSVPNGKTFIVFLQKDKSAYACEFVTVTVSRCESLN